MAKSVNLQFCKTHQKLHEMYSPGRARTHLGVSHDSGETEEVDHFMFTAEFGFFLIKTFPSAANHSDFTDCRSVGLTRECKKGSRQRGGERGARTGGNLLF